jgi:hypothetical protein
MSSEQNPPAESLLPIPSQRAVEEVIIPPLLLKHFENNPDVPIEKIRNAMRQLRTLEHGAHALTPMYCKGDSCSYKESCPLLKANIRDMIGTPCPIEGHLLNLWANKYITDLKIDENNLVETNLAGEIAKLDIYSMRINNRLAYEDYISKQVVAINEEGKPQYRDELHVAAQWEDMLSRRKLRLLDALLATRKSLAEAGGGSTSDPSTHAAIAMKLVKKAQKNLQKQTDNIKAETAKQIE